MNLSYELLAVCALGLLFIVVMMWVLWQTLMRVLFGDTRRPRL